MTTGKNRGRIETRTVHVFDNLHGIDAGWVGVRSFIQVRRDVVSKHKTTTETAYFISSLPPAEPAKYFAEGIRNHWGIENCLHYPKDVTFREDASKVRTKQAPENLSLVRNVAINLFRGKGYDNLAQAIRMVAHDIPALWGMVSA